MESNRPEHLAANWAVSLVLGLGAVGVLKAGIHPVVLSIPGGCFLGELWATADRDHPSAKLRYWWLYRSTIPRHRHPRSHSILPGTLWRFTYGFTPALAAYGFVLADIISRAENPMQIPGALLDSGPVVNGFLQEGAE